MTCIICQEPAVSAEPHLCQAHFTQWVEETVRETITAYELLKPDWRIAVAASGGKDSTSLLSILKKLGYHVEALAIDEGIPGYRDQTLEDLKTFTRQEGIPLRIIRVAEAYGTTIQHVAEAQRIIPCRVCGVWRRRLLERAALGEGYDALATGHNLDDEVQSLLMNLAKAQLSVLARQQPITGGDAREGFTRRVKPFILLSEKHIALYSILKRFPVRYVECPYHERGFRHRVRIPLSYQEKKTLLLSHYRMQYATREEPLTRCRICGLPSSRSVCAACAYAKSYGENTSQNEDNP